MLEHTKFATGKENKLVANQDRGSNSYQKVGISWFDLKTFWLEVLSTSIKFSPPEAHRYLQTHIMQVWQYLSAQEGGIHQNINGTAGESNYELYWNKSECRSLAWFMTCSPVETVSRRIPVPCRFNEDGVNYKSPLTSDGMLHWSWRLLSLFPLQISVLISTLLTDEGCRALGLRCEISEKSCKSHVSICLSCILQQRLSHLLVSKICFFCVLRVFWDLFPCLNLNNNA